MQDLVGACIIIGLLWLVVKLAFGGSPSQSSSAQGAGGNGRGSGLSSVSKESAAAQAWRESKDERQRQLKKRKQDMIEAARRKLLEQDGTSPKVTGGSSSSNLTGASDHPTSSAISA